MKTRHRPHTAAAAAPPPHAFASEALELPGPAQPAAPAPDLEQLARHARAARIAACERQVLAAIAPILERHRCRLGTVQEIVDGQAGPVRVVVFAND